MTKKPSKEAAKKAVKVAAKKSSTQPGLSKKDSAHGTHYDIHASADTKAAKKRKDGSEDGGYSAAGKHK